MGSRMSITQNYLKIYLDLQEHCDTCVGKQIGSNQPAARAMDLRSRGYVFKKYGSQYATNKFCVSCDKNTPHRLLENAEPINDTARRSGFPKAFRERVLKIHKNWECVSRRTMKPTQLEIEHRIPHARQNADEELDYNMSDDQIKKTFQLMTTQNNSWKRESCNVCISKNQRPNGIGNIKYFYKGTEKYEGICEGCYFYDPDTWQKSLNKMLDNNIQTC